MLNLSMHRNFIKPTVFILTLILVIIFIISLINFEYTLASPEIPAEGLVLWLDASAIVGLVDGDPVATWGDKSSSNNDASQGDVSNRPTYKTNVLNGEPVVRFDGVDDYMVFPEISTIRTCFLVVKWTGNYTDSTVAYAPILGHTTKTDFHGSDNEKLFKWASSKITSGSGYINGVETTPSSMEKATEFQIISLITTDNVYADRITNDRHFNRYWRGDYAEIIIYDRALDEGERKEVEWYLAQKYYIEGPEPPPEPEPLSISGTVKDGGGNPLNNIWVMLYREGEGAVGDMYTGVDGLYHFDIDEPGDYLVWAGGKGWAGAVHDHERQKYPPEYHDLHWIPINNDGPTFIAVFIMTEPAGVISGTVKDEGESPVADARVTLCHPHDHHCDQRHYVYTDDLGKFTIDWAWPDEYVASARAEGFGITYYNNVHNYYHAEWFHLGAEDVMDINFILQDGGRIFGQVRDNHGNPLEGAYLNLDQIHWHHHEEHCDPETCDEEWHWHRWHFHLEGIHTDANGYYEFNTGINPDQEYHLNVGYVDHHNRIYYTEDYHDFETYAGHMDHHRDFDLQPGGAISGRVLDGTNGDAPLPHVSVEARSTSDYHRWHGSEMHWWHDDSGQLKYIIAPIPLDTYTVMAPNRDRWTHEDSTWEHEFHDNYLILTEANNYIDNVDITLREKDQYDFTMWLHPGWSLLSTPLPISAFDLPGDDLTDNHFEAFLSHGIVNGTFDWIYDAGPISNHLANPGSAVFFKANSFTLVRFKWDDHPGGSFANKGLREGWNIIGTGTQTSVPNILANVWYSNGTGVTQLYNPRSFNWRKEHDHWHQGGLFDEPLHNLRDNVDYGKLNDGHYHMGMTDGFWINYRGDDATYSVPVDFDWVHGYTDWWRHR